MNDGSVSTLDEKKDRRGLLALIGAGGAAAVAALLTRSNSARADDYRPPAMFLSETGRPAVNAVNNGDGSGIQAWSAHMDAVWGWCWWEGAGVKGYSDTGPGVSGDSNSL